MRPEKKQVLVAGQRPSDRSTLVLCLWLGRKLEIGGENLAPSWGSGVRVLWLCLGMACFFIMRSDEVFAGASGVVHAAHCLTRGYVAFFAGESQLDILGWHRADRVEVRLRGHKGNQGQAGSVIVRTRSAVWGPRSGLGTGGGAVAPLPSWWTCCRGIQRFPNTPPSPRLASPRIVVTRE